MAVYFCRRGLNLRTKSSLTLRHSSYRALHHINLDLKMGDRVGIVGKNGAGKSSLLRVLAKIYRPNAGLVQIEGKISTIFDIHLGMNHEMSGYDNIINLGIMRGMSKRCAESIINEVEVFTELEKHLARPIKTYSAGMQMKLAFAVATAFSPEILLIDEVIGVGDIFFMEQAIRRLNDTVSKSHIMILTSHSHEIIRQFCTQVMVMEKGEMTYFGSVEEGLAFYHEQSPQ